MREILFKGKPKYKNDVEFVRPDLIKDDGFIYGSLVVSNGKYLICTFAVCSHKTFVDNTRATMIEVIPETVGQYTGLEDKNGKRIFEGDIVKGSWNTVFVVFWDTDYLQFRARTKGSKGYFREIDFFRGRNGIEVIGNIHENDLEEFKNGG